MRKARLSALIGGAVAAAAIAFPPVAPAGAADAAKIAVFEFELNDVSGRSGFVAPDALDRDNLKKMTEDARRLLAASGRYSVVDTAGAGDVPHWGLRSCQGCEAGMARKVGADLSLVGVVTRTAGIVYTVQIVIRDASTGALVSSHYSGGQLGADRSWSRSVKWLMEHEILAAPAAK